MTSPDASMRLFVALELPDGWKDALGKLQDEMRAGLRERFGDSVRPRWVRPENVHLTIKFLGETPSNRIEAIETALRHAVPERPAFRLELANVGSFAGRRAPQIILAGVYGETKALFTLVERVETWLAASEFPRDKRSFLPHLTLARLPETLDDQTRRAIAEVTTSYSAPDVPAWNVESVSLMRSHLGPNGSRYERIASFPA